MSFDQLGTKICIIGCSSAGKSTLADIIGKKYKRSVTHLDLLAHEPGTRWKRVSDDKLIQSQQAVLIQDRWIIEGNYSVCMSERLALASVVLWLDFNVVVCLFRFLRRALKPNVNRPGRLIDAKNEFSWSMVKQILCVYPKNRLKYEKMLQDYSHLPVIRIRSPVALRKYYKRWGLLNVED